MTTQTSTPPDKATPSPTPRTEIVALRSIDRSRYHGPAWVIACPRCGRDAYAWMGGRPRQERSSGWSCISCGKSGGLWKIQEAA